MQSGITASQELVSQFNELLSNSTNFALLTTISSESLKPLELLPASSISESSFDHNLTSLLQPRLKPNEALYILLRRWQSAPPLVAVTYIPDSAPVRQKMLFASTRLTLVRELGSEHFRETMIANSAEELTPDGFRRHDDHTNLEAPLTEEERTLGEVKRAEQEAGAGTGVRRIHMSETLTMNVDEEALAALREVADPESGKVLVMLRIEPDSERIQLAESPDNRPTSIAELAQAISPTMPRYTFFRYTHTHGGETSSPVLFFYTCPSSQGRQALKFRMLYSLMKRALLAAAETEAGLAPDKRFEVEGTSEITEEDVLAELHPQMEEKKGFSRPKRPGRGR